MKLMQLRNLLLRIAALAAIVIFFVSCGSLRTAEFRGPGPYQTPLSSSYTPSGAFDLTWPVPQIRITQHFRPAENRRHQGLDLGGRRGSPILAAHEGVVIYAGQGFRGYGKMVMIEYDSKWASLYAHLDRIDVREGDRVYGGDVIGKMGRTGRATGVHLHFELMRNKLPVNPLQYLRIPESLVSK